jgi:endonuclease-8
VAVETHGKNLALTFGNGLLLISHLGMSGSWRVLPATAAVSGAPWLVVRGSQRQAVLRGGARLTLDRRALARLGPDILADPLDVPGILSRIRASDPRREIADVLLDQDVVAGIGNIWRSESLWAACVSPWLPVGDLSDVDVGSVLQEASELMALSARGSSGPRSVYRRSGRPCPRCGVSIASGRLGEHGRTVYWCPACQPAERGDGAGGA